RLHVLRVADDADRLRGALAPGADVLIVGAGLIGAEVASTARQLGCAVTLADAVSPPLSGAFGTDIAAWLHDIHVKQGVTTGRGAVTGNRDAGNRVAVVFSGEDNPRTFDAVLLAVGMAPDTRLAQTAGLHVERGTIVDGGQVTSNAAVLAVGDA